MSQTQSPKPVNPAEAYENSLVKRVFQPLANQVVQKVQPQAGDRVLDVAAGTGICLREVAQLAGNSCRLVGLDLNPAMVAVGRAVAESTGVEIEWHEGNASQLPFEDSSFDWIFCQHGLQFFPDKRTALSEMWRVLDDGGRAVVAVWQDIDRHPYSRAIDEAGLEHTGDHVLRVPNGPFSLGDPDELAELFKQAGFKSVEIETVSFHSRWDDPIGGVRMDVAGATAVVPALQKLSDAERADLIAGIMTHLEPAVEQFIEDGVLVNLWHANVAIATK